MTYRKTLTAIRSKCIDLYFDKTNSFYIYGHVSCFIGTDLFLQTYISRKIKIATNHGGTLPQLLSHGNF